MVKIVIFFKRKPAMSVDDFQKYWKDVHGPLCKQKTLTIPREQPRVQ